MVSSTPRRWGNPILCSGGPAFSMISVGGSKWGALFVFQGKWGDGGLLIGFPYLIWYIPSWKVSHSVILVCSYKVLPHCNYFRLKPSLLSAMRADTAPFSLGVCFAFLPCRKVSIFISCFQHLFSTGFGNSDQLVTCWGSALTNHLVKSIYVLCCNERVGYLMDERFITLSVVQYCSVLILLESFILFGKKIACLSKMTSEISKSRTC